MDSFTYEQQKLATVLDKLMSLKAKLQAIPRYYGRDIVEQALDDQRQNQLKNLEIAQVESYFGRLDFQETGIDKAVPLYIGKAGVQDDQTNELLVIDWRAPIASMFYSFTGQDASVSYTSPDGVVTGDIFLKRNIVIRHQDLQRVVDSYVRGSENIGAADEFLLYRLGENKDNRLQDIVSTIQQEQDQIIRADYNKALIIQGVPGSGKTTVALHRLAFLLYQYQQKIKAEKIIVFAPNQMFMDYISDVLPELGVGDIQQTTFAAWAVAMVDEELKVRDRHQPSTMRLETVHHNHPAAYHKGSYAFLTHLQQELDDFEAIFVPEEGFIAWDNAELSSETIKHWFYEEYKHYPLMKRKERIMTRIKRWIETEHKEISGSDRKGALKKQANKRLTAYKKVWPNQTALQWYHSLLSQKPSKKKEVDYEDLAPLVFIHDQFYGISHKYDHIVIDEAQDFSPFQVALLKDHCPSQSFTILGDILQNIYGDQGISHWNEFAELFSEHRLELYQLDRSYRSTMEIIQFANEIITPYRGDVSAAKPVFRSGEPVRVIQKTHTERTTWLEQTIRELEQKNTNTIAVVMHDNQ